jgi:nucleotide-binding universal stress UspA family protein
MGYKSILTVVTNKATAHQALEAATEVARREKGHLDVLCLGIDRTQTGYYYAGASAVILQETLDRAQKEAEALGEFVKAKMQAEDLAWGTESAVAQIAGLARLVADRARFADLVVLPRPYGKGRGIEDEAVIEAALFEGDAPVLMVPESGLPEGLGGRIVVAWNESAEALAAVRKAMPMLAKADLVDIAIIDPPQHGPDRSDPGGRLSQMIARQGVRAEVSVLAKTMSRVSDVLRRHAVDRSADLVVMGAYGHSRFREAILGGATRNMLETCEIPILLAH